MSRMHSRHKWLVPLAILALLAGMSAGCGAGQSSEGEAEAEIVTVQRGSLVASTMATGSILPVAEVALSFQMGGQVSEVLVQEGEHVQKGQMLARLDPSELALQVRGAEAALAGAQAQLDQLRAGPRPEEVAAAQANLDAAQAALSAATAERQRLEAGAIEAEIAAAEAQVASALAQQKIAQDTHDDTMRCETITLPTGERKKICPALGKFEEQARYSLHAADEALKAAQASLEALQASADYQIGAARANQAGAIAQRDAAQAQLNLLLAGATSTQIAAAVASVAQAQVALDSARLTLEKAVLIAPFDGIVARVDVEPGVSVAPNVPVVTLVDNSLFRIEADVDEADIGWVEVGLESQITLDAFPGHALTGHVSAIAPSATFDAGIVLYKVTVELNPSDLPLRGGMTTNVEIIREQREDILLVPNAAIWLDPDTGQAFVEKMVDEEIIIVPIEQGIADEQMSEILSGLEEGDQLAVRSVSLRERFRKVVTMPMTGQ